MCVHMLYVQVVTGWGIRFLLPPGLVQGTVLKGLVWIKIYTFRKSKDAPGSAQTVICH